MKITENKSVKDRIVRLVAFWTILFLIGSLYALWCYIGLPGLKCAFYEITGLQCPGCGNTRAVLALLRLDFSGAWGYNPMIYPTIAYILWISISASVAYIKTGTSAIEAKPMFIHVIFLALLLIWAVLRNTVFG